MSDNERLETAIQSIMASIDKLIHELKTYDNGDD